MKRFLIAATVMLALVSCAKGLDEQEPSKKEDPETTSFIKGQEVIISCGQEQTKVVSSSDGAGGYNFKWEAGDQILVTVHGSTDAALFDLIEGAETSTAKFKGFMPASGNKFDIQYPTNDPDLSTQTYSSTEPIPHDKMKFTASDCTLTGSNTLEAENTVLRLNLYGIDRKVSKIVITNTTSTANPQPSYTLNCTTAVKVGNSEETATPFQIVVPSGSTGWTFSVRVSASETTPTSSIPSYSDGSYTGDGVVVTNEFFSTKTAQSFGKGKILNMPSVCITTVWAPVNCGYDATNYKYGKLYQWGRKDGQGYDSGDASCPNLVRSQISNLNNLVASNFYHGNKTWYSGSNPDPDVLWKEDERSNYDPCPGGWKVPTEDQLKTLTNLSTKLWVTNRKVDGTESGTYNGYLFDNKLFLPAAGGRHYMEAGVSGRNEHGYYWSSSVTDNPDARACHFNNTKPPYTYSDGRGGGCSVRCVVDEKAVYPGATLPGDMPNVSVSW